MKTQPIRPEYLTTPAGDHVKFPEELLSSKVLDLEARYARLVHLAAELFATLSLPRNQSSTIAELMAKYGDRAAARFNEITGQQGS